MLRLDDRAGSRELYSALLSTGVGPIELCRLPYGDIEFDGLGPDDMPVTIGIEHKRVDDVLKCIQDGRFAGHQLPGLLSRYDYVWLVVEGGTRPGPTGALQVEHQSGRWFDAVFGRRTFQCVDFDMWLTGIEVRGGIRIRRTRDQKESASYIAALSRWWQKPFDQHRTHLAFNQSDRPSQVFLQPPNIVRRMAKELPGIGWERSGAIADVFVDPVAMVAATEEEWSGIDGIGRTTAKKIMKELGSDKLWSK